MNTSIESIMSDLDVDLAQRVSVVNEIIDQTVYFNIRSESSGRRTSGNFCVPHELREERLIVVPGQMMSTAYNSVATNAAIAEATGLAVVGLELPGHGVSDKLTKYEKERVGYGDYQWLADDYASILDGYALISQIDSARRFIFGISAGAVAATHLVQYGGIRYEKIALQEPANLSPRSTVSLVINYLHESNYDTNGAEELLGKYNEGLETPDTPVDPRDLLVFLHTSRNFPWNGETTNSIIKLLENNQEINIGIIACSESGVSTSRDIQHLRNKVNSRSAKMAARVKVETIDGINHNIGRYPLVVGQLAARAFEL